MLAVPLTSIAQTANIIFLETTHDFARKRVDAIGMPK